MRPADELEREDLLQFLNAAFVSTGQGEFYSTAGEQRVSLAFLHEYVRGNYRRLYARMLAAGLNDFNTAEIIVGLLASGGDTPADFRAEENALLRAAVRRLPSQRFWKLAARLRHERINNRRARALVRDYALEHHDLPFQSVKYRRKVRTALAHAHVHPPGEIAAFLFGPQWYGPFRTPVLEAYRRARHSMAAVRELPSSVAWGFLTGRRMEAYTGQWAGLSPDELARRLAHQFTDRERLRAQSRSGEITVRPERLAPTEVASHLLGLADPSPLQLAWLPAAASALISRRGRLPVSGRVAAVLDCSYSSSGSRHKRARPLAVAWAVDAVLAAGLDDYRAWWTSPPSPSGAPRPIGQTNLGERLIDCLEWGARTIIVVSDGVENDPPGAYHAVLSRARELVPGLDVVHLNPVFDPDRLDVHSPSPLSPAIGLRGAEDLHTALGFSRFVSGHSTLADLEGHLARLSAQLIAADAGGRPLVHRVGRRASAGEH